MQFVNFTHAFTCAPIHWFFSGISSYCWKRGHAGRFWKHNKPSDSMPHLTASFRSSCSHQATLLAAVPFALPNQDWNTNYKLPSLIIFVATVSRPLASEISVAFCIRHLCLTGLLCDFRMPAISAYPWVAWRIHATFSQCSESLENIRKPRPTCKLTNPNFIESIWIKQILYHKILTSGSWISQ